MLTVKLVCPAPPLVTACHDTDELARAGIQYRS